MVRSSSSRNTVASRAMGRTLSRRRRRAWASMSFTRWGCRSQDWTRPVPFMPLGQVAGFAAGGGAHVQQLHARPGFDQRQGGKHAALALDAEAARLEVRVPGQMSAAP